LWRSATCGKPWGELVELLCNHKDVDSWIQQHVVEENTNILGFDIENTNASRQKRHINGTSALTRSLSL